MKVLIHWFCVIALCLFCTCGEKSKDGYSLAGAHVKYKIISFDSQSTHIEHGDLVEFKCLYLKNNTDTLLPDSTQLNEIYNDTITINNNQKSAITLLFKQLQEGDSVLAKLTMSANFSKKINTQVSAINEHDTIYAYIKIKRIYRGKEQAAYRLEENAIARYITFSGFDWKATQDGIYYRKIKPSNHSPLQSNDAVKLVYKGYFLNNMIFDNYADINPYFEHRIGTQNQLIRGMELALQYISYGAEAEFIFPSSLAFGTQGSSTGIVPAFKPLLYKVKILERAAL